MSLSTTRTDAALLVTCAFDTTRKELTAALSADAPSLVVRYLLAAQLKDAATALAKHPRPGVRHLRLEQLGFDPADEVGPAALSPKLAAQLLDALPDLRHLELIGHAILRELAHPTLETLEMTGFSVTGSFQKKPADCPRLTTLRWAFTEDAHGVALEPRVLKTLWAGDGLPALTHLDLGAAVFDGSLASSRTVTRSPLVGRLTTLTVPEDDAPLEAPFVAADSTPPPVSLAPEAADGHWSTWGLKDEAVERLGAALEGCGTVRGLTLTWTHLCDAGYALGQVLARHPELERLTLSDPSTYGLSAAGMEGLAASLAGHPGLRVLELRNHRPTAAGIAPLAALVGQLPALERLHVGLKGSTPTPDALEALVAALSRAPHLTWVDATRLGGGDAAATTWATLLAHPRLDTLILGRSEIGSDGARALATAVGTSRVTTLGLAGNPIDATGLAALASADVQDLDLARVGAAGTPEGLAALAGLVATRLTLTPDPAHAQALATAIAGWSTLTHLDLDDTRLGGDAALEVATAIGRAPALHALSGFACHQVDLDDVAAALTAGALTEASVPTTALAVSLVTSAPLQALSLTTRYELDTRIPQVVDAALAGHLPPHVTLRGGLFGKDAARAIARLLTEGAVEHLTVSGAMGAANVVDILGAAERCATLRRLDLEVGMSGPVRTWYRQWAAAHPALVTS